MRDLPELDNFLEVFDRVSEGITRASHVVDMLSHGIDKVADAFGEDAKSSTTRTQKKKTTATSHPKTLPTDISKQDIATACVACAVGHFSTSSGLLKEALRFKNEGMDSNEVLDRLAGVLEEQNALEREDLSQEKIQRLPEWEREIAEEALERSRQLRHTIEAIQTIEELEQLTADTRSYYLTLSRQWYKGRFSNLGAEKADAISQRVGG